LLTVLALATAASATEIGTERTLGIGPMFGTATGGSGHVYLGSRRYALDFGFGAAHGEGVFDAVLGHVNLHRHVPLATIDGVYASWHVGVGGFASTRDAEMDGGATAYGVRLPVGVDLDLVRTPLQFVLEVSPLSLTVAPVTRYGLDASLSVRYYL